MDPAPAVTTETPMNEVIDVASEGSAPVAVTDPAGRLRGVVVKGAILAALARPGRDGGEDHTPAAAEAAVPAPTGTAGAVADRGRHV